jgi:predicted MFS family arabinose efflux permease
MSISAEGALEQDGTGSAREAERHLRRNFSLGVVSGVAYNVYTVVLSTELVVASFVSELTDSNLIISLLVPVEMGSWFFLQLLLSGYVQRQPRALPLYRLMAGVRLVAVGLLVLATFALGESQWLLIVFLLSFAVNSVAAGVAALPFVNIVAKTIPPTRRGTYFGLRRFTGAFLGLGFGLLVKQVLAPDSGLAFPYNYGLLFFLGFWITAVLVVPFGFVVEPAEVVDSRRVSLGEQLRRAVRLPVRDRNYGRYLGLRVAYVVAIYALPFYAVYARRELGAPGDVVGTYLVGLTVASMLSNLVLGRVADRHGNRLVLRLAAFAIVVPPIVALVVGRLPGAWLDRSLLLALVFLFQGVHIAARVIGSTNYVLEIAPSRERVVYVGFAHGIVGLAFFTSTLGGALVDWLGFEALFLVSLAGGLIAVVLSMRLEEPRKRTEVVAGQSLVQPQG